DESGLKKDTYSMHTMYQGSADIRNIDYHSKIVVEKVKSVGSSAKEDHKAIAEHVDKEIIFDLLGMTTRMDILTPEDSTSEMKDVVLSQVVQGPAEGETLRCACGSWLKKVEEFQNSSKVGDREGIGVENEVIWKSSDIGIEEGMMNIGRCYRDGIEWYVKRGEFDPGGFYYQSGIVAVKYEEKALELYPKPAKDKDPDTQDYLGNRSFAIIILKNTLNAHWCGITGKLSNSRKEEFGPEQVLTFDAAAGRVKESVKMEPNRSKGKMELEKLAETQQREWSRGTSTLSRGEM
ncbi:5909_t:CDS:2, partial [Gigaspora rosea]